MNNPIKTIKHGDIIAKVCVENISKILRKIEEIEDDHYDDLTNVCDDYKNRIVKGVGLSRPTDNDKYDEEIGNEIAFRKAKLYCNLKKIRLIEKVMKTYMTSLDKLQNELDRYATYVNKDVAALKEYNPEFDWNLWK